VGLAASKLTERFWRPAFVFCEEDGLARGSARSIPGFPLFDAIRRCEHLVETYGGHAGAAGLSVSVEKLSSFAEAMNEIARSIIGETPPTPRLNLEGEVELSQLSPGVMGEIEMLAPFGMGNPDPLFAAHELRVAGNPQLVGSRRNHLSFMARQGETTTRVIAFGKADWLKPLREHKDEPFSLAFEPRIDNFNGYGTVVLRAEDIQWADERAVETRPAGCMV
jgi:single-stranded-DNA-specific exonuclease